MHCSFDSAVVKQVTMAWMVINVFVFILFGERRVLIHSIIHSMMHSTIHSTPLLFTTATLTSLPTTTPRNVQSVGVSWRRQRTWSVCLDSPRCGRPWS